MAGTPTWGGDLTAAADFKLLSIHTIDASGDQDSASIYVPVATTSAEMDDIVSAYQGCTQASVWKVTVSSLWEGDADPDNAQTDQRNSVKQGINIGFKNVATRTAFELRVVAPVTSIMQGNQDIPLVSVAPLSTLIIDTLTAADGFSAVSAQYTERRERRNNPKVKL